MVDYSGFRLSRIREPRFSHLLLILGWVFYFSMYFITENLIPAERCTPIYCPLDDLIPFDEAFAVFYVGWYFLVFGSLLFYLLFDAQRFRELSTFIIVTQVVAMLCYVLFPSRQDLRPTDFPRDNFLTHVMIFIYSFDTSTGVCPSLHVAYSMGVLSVFWKDRNSSALWKILLLLIVIMICLAVCFVKQHSALDVLAALPVSLLAELFVFGKTYWKPRIHATKT